MAGPASTSISIATASSPASVAAFTNRRSGTVGGAVAEHQRRRMTKMAEVSHSDETAVRAVETAYDRAWSAGDLEALLACVMDDAVLINPRGEIAAGADEIRAALGGFLLGEAKGSVHESAITRISFVGDDVAVVDGRAVIRKRGSEHPLFEHPFTDIVVRTTSGWAIAHVRAYTYDSA